MASLPVQHRQLIIDTLIKGEYVGKLAPQLGITPNAITNALSNDPEYRAAREIGIESRLEQKERDLEVAESGLCVSRARELLAHQRWRAAVEAPERWGEKKQLHVTGTITLDSLLADIETIEGEAKQVDGISEGIK
tara:strand:- start:6602 stop:7009 length:408 start_codon:yes stop_codon:yes gene_type:complete